MNVYFLAAGILAIFLGLAHTVLGEVLIFKRLRGQKLYFSNGEILEKRGVAALWSTWHLLTIIGWGIAAVLLSFAWPNLLSGTIENISKIFSITFLIGGVFWFYGTNGKHPAWVVLLAIAGLLWLAGL